MVLEVVVTESSRSSSSTPETFGSTPTIRDTSSPRTTAVGDDDQGLASLSSEDLSPINRDLVYDTHPSQYVELQQESSQLNINHSINGHLPRPLEQQQELNQWTQQMEQQMDHQMEELQQTMAVLEQRMKEFQQVRYSEQSAHHSNRYARQQIDMVEQPSLLPEHQTRQPWQKQADMILQKMQQLLDSTREEISQRQYRHSLVHYRIQELLNASLRDLPAPRFFIVLPVDTSLSEGQRKSPTLTFRLHFLCEGISYSTTKDTKGTSDIHMTDHPGYDIKNPKEFFGKYGPYILTTMYMIKYGATASEFVVPPLAYSKLVARIGENQEYLASVKKNIDRLVDIAISYLEGTSIIDSEINTSHWTLALADKAELRSYLDNIEDKPFLGDLHQLATQERHCSSWMCGEHHHQRIIQHLKDVVNAIGGKYSEDPKRITINCDTVDERLFDAMIEFCKAQTTCDTSLNADIGQLSLTASASKEGQEVSVTIDRLGDLTMNGVKFIKHCSLTKLTVRYTPKDTDEARLVDILNQSLELEELHIRCNGERCYSIIHLVISARETAIQGGRTPALHILNVTDERLDKVCLYRGFDGHDHIKSSVTFSKGSTVFDMDTYMTTQDSMLDVEGSSISNFFRQFGWSISRLAASPHFSDHLATLLDDSTEERGSRLSQLRLSPFSLSTFGLDALDRVIKRSQHLTFLWLYCVSLEMESQSEKALLLLGRYGERLNRLSLCSCSMEKWLLPFTRALPTVNNLPKLDYLYMWCNSKQQVPPEFIQWLVTATPDRLRPPVSNEGSSTGKTLQTRKSCTMLDRLRTFTFSLVTLRPQDWEILIKAIDLSELKELYLSGTNFSSQQLDLLLERVVTADPKAVSLKVLGLGNTELLVNADKSALRARILMAAPEMSIQGL